MSQLLTLELNDEVYIAMMKQAEAAGISLTEWAMVTIQRQSEISSTHDLLAEEEKQAARERFEKHFGEIFVLNDRALSKVACDLIVDPLNDILLG